MYTIRKATTDDCKLIHELAEKTFIPTYQDIHTPEQSEYMMNWMYSIESLTTQMIGKHTYFILYKEEKPCGYLSVEEEGEDLFHLQKIYVLPDYQGTGAGKILFEKAIQFIKEIHPAPCTMELNVHRSNKSVHFYEKMGMKIAREGDFHIGNGFYMNDYIMSLDL